MDKRFKPFPVCGEGDVQGILVANCRHSYGPGDGVHNPYEQYDSEENKKAYELSQRQRLLERRIRKTKRRVMGLQEAIDNAQTDAQREAIERKHREASALLGKQNRAYNEFCEQNDLKRQADRIQIARWGREQARRSIQAEKEHGLGLEKKAEFDRMVSELKEAGVPKSAKVNYPPLQIDANSLTFDDAHINNERGHSVTRAMAENWITESKISVSVWGGRFERFYAADGVVYVDVGNRNIRTAYSKAQYDAATLAIMEVINKNGY